MLKHIQKGEFEDYNSDDEAEWYNTTHGVKAAPAKKDYYTPRKPKVEADVEIAPHTTRAELNNYLGANLDATTRANAEEFVAAKYGEIIKRNNELEYQIQNSSVSSSYGNERRLQEQIGSMQAEIDRLRMGS